MSMQAMKVNKVEICKYLDGLLLKNKCLVLRTIKIKISDSKLSINQPVLVLQLFLHAPKPFHKLNFINYSSRRCNS